MTKAIKYERESAKSVNYKILNSKGGFSLGTQVPQKLEIIVDRKHEIQAIIQENEKIHEYFGG